MTKTKPWPLKLYYLQVDLKQPDLEIISVITADPDGNGPAEAALATPTTLAEKSNALVMINANAFGALREKDGHINHYWAQGKPIFIMGFAAHNGKIYSKPSRNSFNFWIDTQNQPHFDYEQNPMQVREGIGGFGMLIHNGKIALSKNQQRKKLGKHPRTAIGIDAQKRYLYLLVIDGRQPKTSVGVTLGELADYMKKLGCYQAGNLDGGGSSIMVLQGSANYYRIVNEPSTHILGFALPRPIPVALAVRKKTSTSNESN